MDKKERNTYDITEDASLGTVQVADEVVAVIAGLAATEVDGVDSVAGNISAEIMSKAGVKNLSRGVKIDIKDRVVSVDVSLVMKYGFNIPETCSKVQEKIKATVENMTGLKVENVNIRITGVDMNTGK